MILHITTPEAWATAVAHGRYIPDSLQHEGFIHCSTLAQTAGTANKHYAGAAGLQLLCIDPQRLSAPLVYEDSYGSGQEFPHIYGPLNLDAVTRVLPFPPQADGTFILPQSLQP